jgi:hypothetical protein
VVAPSAIDQDVPNQSLGRERIQPVRTTYLFACLKHQVDLTGEPKLTAVDGHYVPDVEGQEYEIDMSFMDCPQWTEEDNCIGGNDWVVVTRTGPEGTTAGEKRPWNLGGTTGGSL